MATTLPLTNTAVVEVIGRGFTVHGTLQEAHTRVSDHFNEQRHMIFVGDARITGVGGFLRKAGTVGINRDEIVLVIPVEEVFESTQLRIEKTRLPVRMVVDRWQLRGQVTVVHGVSLERFVNIGPESFIPVLDARLTGAGADRNERLVLVRREAIRLLVPSEG
ncbi:MAG: hypothetical protein E6J20_19460 [Chloroflexi bacterium]|nr:MAG: hypothetical protein E6J20_19460 [Chloroflexota bacterium]